MRLSIITLAVAGALGIAGCVVREPTYSVSATYATSGYPVYYADGYYWAYNDGWYMWSHDGWIVSHYAPRHYVVVNSHGRYGHHGHHGHHGNHGSVRTRVRDHRTHGAPGTRTPVRDHRTHGSPRTSAPPRSAPPPRGGQRRDHRRH